MCQRVKEWYGLHFPELDSCVEDQVEYIKVVKVLNNRLEFTEEKKQELEDIFESLYQIKHVERLRIHSRLPIVLPSRITNRFINLMRDTPLHTSLVVHVNHPNELDNPTIASLRRCKESGLTLLNQSVLLKNINNDIETLTKLSEVLFSAGVLPYYIHLLDRVRGAAHFEVSDTEALCLEAQLRTRLSGYLMPTFVREISNRDSKIPLSQI
jgi:KamA family protein